jgi:hypothetical protein
MMKAKMEGQGGISTVGLFIGGGSIGQSNACC